MAKLIVALCLLFGANAMGIYGGEKNGCGQTCLAVETLNSLPFPLGTIESDTCYVVEGTFPSPADALFVSSLVKCAKITIPSGSGLNAIGAHLPRPFLNRAREMMRRGARRSPATTR